MKRELKIKLTTKLSLLLFVLAIQYNTAQTVNNDRLFINDGGEFHVAVGSYTFGNSPAETKTTKGTSNYGVISFAQGVTWSGASDSHFIDGFARYYGNDYFLCPVGNNAVYAPAGIDANNTGGTDVAYFRNNPTTLSATVDATIESISNTEYWKVNGSGSAKISLTWRASSGISSLLLTPSLTYLTIVGFDGTKWVEIPSFYDINSILNSTSDVSQGSITSTGEVALSSYQAYSLGVKGNPSCYPVVLSSGNTKTWNGTSWSPSAPALTDPVIINQPYNAGSFSAYSVELNADVTLADGQTLDIVDSFTGTGKVIMSSEASVMQRNALATAPKILLTKITNPMRRYDYAFLSSPIQNFATFFSDLNSALKTAVNGQFGQYPNSIFYNFLTDNSAGAQVNVTSSNVAIGRGFTAAVSPVQAPYTVSSAPGSWFTEKYPIHIKTEGTTSNGDINVPMPTATGWARIGNPYPSPINANKLLDALGDDIRKTIYYWTFNTPRQNWENNSLNYNNNDFATFNYSGGVAACGGCQEPTGMIATMQSVYVRKVQTAPITFTMTNCLRDLEGNDQFFRTASAKGKFRLNLTGTSGSFSQILVAYNPVATTGYDNGYDSARMSSGLSSEFNTLIEGQNSGYAIQTRGEFEITDVVPVQMIKRVEENFTISLANKDGIFNSEEVKIYLFDKTLNTYHDLSLGGYTFMQSATPDNARFEIVYQAEALSNNDVLKNNAVAFISNQTFNAQSKFNMAEIHLFDLTGRLIQTYTNINSTFLSRPFHYPQSVYIAKIKLEDGSMVSQKVINN